MTRTRKIIVLASVVLIIIALAFPPCDRWIEWPSRDAPEQVGWTWIGKMGVRGSPEYRRIRWDVLSGEVIGILVLAGAAYLVSKKVK